MPELPDAASDQLGSGPVPAEVPQVEEEPKPKTEVSAETDEEPETEEQKPKRLGGWQRKIAKLEQEAEFWREEALRTRAGSQDDKPALPKEPEYPKLATFQGTVAEYEAAIEKYAKDVKEYNRFAAQQEANQQRAQQAQQGLLSSLKSMEDYDAIDEGAGEYPPDLVPGLAGECALLKNGAQVFRELCLDPELREEISRRYEIRDFAGIKAQISTLGYALRKTQAKAEPEPAAKAPKPKPINPVKKTAPTDTGLSDDLPIEEWTRRRNQQVKDRGGRIL